MNINSTLYWSNLDYYENCPRRFLWTVGWGTEDLGGGRGYPKPPPIKESRRHPIMGQLIESAVGKFYNDELWHDPASVTETLMDFLDDEWFRLLKDPRNYINWQRAGMSAPEMLELCRENVQGYLRTMKANKLLGIYAKAEVDLVGWIDKWNPVGGRADIIVRREDTGVTILDGKNTQRRERANPDQLRWYALLFKLSYRQLPDRIGFVWYRFPYGTPARDESGNPLYDDEGRPLVEQGVEWVPFTEDDLRGLAQRAVAVKKAMRKEKFDPNPVPSYCKYCVYESVCDARQSQRATNAEKRGKGKKLDEIEDSDGFADFSL